MNNIESKHISLGEAADMLGLSVVTLRRYEKSGKLKSKFRTFGLHRRYDIEDIRKLINPNTDSKKNSLLRSCVEPWPKERPKNASV